MEFVEITKEEINDFKTVNLTGYSNKLFETNKLSFIKNILNKIENFETDSILLMEGGVEIPRFDTDTSHFYFQQESNFYYLTGINEPNFFMYLDLKSHEITVFTKIPNLITRIFQRVPTFDEIKNTYKVNCEFQQDMYSVIENRNPKKIYRLFGINSNSNLSVKTAVFNPPDKLLKLKKLLVDDKIIYEILADTRSRKNDFEVSIMKYLIEKTCEAHNHTISLIHSDIIERDAENFFLSYCRNNYYVRELPYNFICSSNMNVLMYEKNDVKLSENGLILLDMGIKLGGYCSSIATTVPTSGTFTEVQKNIYNLVLKVNNLVIDTAKVGESFLSIHLLAESIILNGLKELNILNSSFSVEEMIEKRIAYYFMPHGISHLIGLDAHDVGGYLSFTPERPLEKGLNQLKSTRNLEEGMIISVGAGIYFLEYLLEQAFNDSNISKYFNKEVIKTDYFEIGGIRIKDNCLVTLNGLVNFSIKIARSITEIENLMKKNKNK